MSESALSPKSASSLKSLAAQVGAFVALTCLQVGAPMVSLLYGTALWHLCVQASIAIVTTLSRRYSPSQGNDYAYDPAVVVAVVELAKFGASLVALASAGQLSQLNLLNKQDIMSSFASAVLYAGVNQLQFLGIRVAGAAGYQVLVNCKVVWTGLLSVSILGRALSKPQWWGLLWLNAGVLAAKYPDLVNEWSTRSSADSSDVPLGIAVGVPVFVGLLSALGGLANQFALQSRKGVLSLHAQNCAMYGVGFVVNATTVMYSRTVTEHENQGLFHGWNRYTVAIAAIMVANGLAVSAVLRLLDVVFKLAAGCASMVLLAACSPWLLGESVSPYTFVGILLVSIGVFQYFQPATPTVAQAPVILKSKEQ